MVREISMVAALVFAGLAACNTSGIGEPPPVASSDDLVDRDVPALTAAEIRIYLRNSTLVHEGGSRLWYVYLRENGTLSGYSEVEDSGAIERARGTWQVTEDGQICRQWDSDWGGGSVGCAKVYQYGEEFVFVGSGASGEELRRTRVPGNPKQL